MLCNPDGKKPSNPSAEEHSEASHKISPPPSHSVTHATFHTAWSSAAQSLVQEERLHTKPKRNTLNYKPRVNARLLTLVSHENPLTISSASGCHAALSEHGRLDMVLGKGAHWVLCCEIPVDVSLENAISRMGADPLTFPVIFASTVTVRAGRAASVRR